MVGLLSSVLQIFFTPTRKASLTDSVRFFPSSSAILRNALSGPVKIYAQIYLQAPAE